MKIPQAVRRLQWPSDASRLKLNSEKCQRKSIPHLQNPARNKVRNILNPLGLTGPLSTGDPRAIYFSVPVFHYPGERIAEKAYFVEGLCFIV